jgi:TonB family protein
MPTALRTRRRVREPRTWPALVAALAVHGAIFGAVNVLGLSIIGTGPPAAATRAQPPPEDAELDASCFDNVVFATSGRTAMCLAPWVGNVDDCLSDAQMSLWIDLSGCQARNDPGTAVTMVEPRAIEQVKPIDPEKLLEEMKKEEPRPPAPRPQPLQPPEPQVAAQAPPPPPPPQPRQQLPQQVVETAKPDKEKEPENARLLAEYSTSVEKQKVARGARNEPMVAKSKQAELTPKDKPRDEPSMTQKRDPDRRIGNNEKAPDVAGRLSMRNPGTLFPAEAEQEARKRGAMTGTDAKVASADGYQARKGDGALEQERRERSEIPRGQAGAGGGVPDVPNLKPTEEVLERALGGGSVDRLDDVENGDETALSAKRWVYASFFNRLKRQVAQIWDPNTVWRRADPTGTRYGSKTRTTEVRVSLSPRGDLVKILVVSPSGSNELDEEAVRAFRAAGPFPNPPEGLVQKDNLITFAFGFTFELGAQQHLTWRLPQAM